MRWSLFPYKGSSPTTCSITPASSKKERACSFTPRPRRRVLGRPEMLALDHRACGTAGDVDGLTADVRGLVGDEEGDNVGDVFHPAEAPQWDILGEPLLHLLHRHTNSFGGLLGHLGLDPAGCDRVDVDVEPPELQRERSGHRLQARLRRRVVKLSFIPQSDDRGGHYDLAVLLLDHVLLNRLGAQKAALHVHVEHRVPVLFAHPEQQVIPQEPRIVDQNVDPTEVVPNLLERRRDLLGVRYVAPDRDNLRTRGLDGLDCLPTGFLGEVQNRDVGPVLCQPYRFRGPDAPGSAGYHRYPSVESAHATTSLLGCYRPTISVNSVLASRNDR